MLRRDEPIKIKALYLLGGILLLSLLLRLYHIDFQSLWLDELYSIIPTNPQSSLSSLIDYCKGDQPPLFFLYIHYVFKVVEYNELVGRLACVLIGVLGVIAMYFLGKECNGRATGLFASYVTGINYFHIYYSQELRFYGMIFLLSAISYFFFIRVCKNCRPIDLLGYIFSVICLLYTHYYGLFVFGAQGLSVLLIIVYRRDLKLFFLAVTAGIIVVIAFIPWIPVIIGDFGADLGWIKQVGPLFVAQYFYYYTGKDAIAALIFVILTYLFIKPMVIKGPRNSEENTINFVIIIWIVVTYLVPYVRGLFFSPMLSDRYTIITLPAWILVFAIGWDKINNYRLKYTLPVILILGFVINMLFFKKHYATIHKSQFREASAIVLQKNKLQYPVYSNLAWTFNFYFRESIEKVIALSKQRPLEEEKFWLLQAHYSEAELEAEINELRKNFKVVEVYPFYEAKAVLMERK